MDVFSIFLVAVAAVFGAVFGSFAGVVLERIPRRLSINGRSECACGRLLKPWENVPVFGWLVARGRARCCGVTLPVWYLTVELVFAGAFALSAALAAAGLPFLAPFPTVAVVAAVAVVTVRRRAAGPAASESS